MLIKNDGSTTYRLDSWDHKNEIPYLLYRHVTVKVAPFTVLDVDDNGSSDFSYMTEEEQDICLIKRNNFHVRYIFFEEFITELILIALLESFWYAEEEVELTRDENGTVSVAGTTILSVSTEMASTKLHTFKVTDHDVVNEEDDVVTSKFSGANRWVEDVAMEMRRAKVNQNALHLMCSERRGVRRALKAIEHIVTENWKRRFAASVICNCYKHQRKYDEVFVPPFYIRTVLDELATSSTYSLDSIIKTCNPSHERVTKRISSIVGQLALKQHRQSRLQDVQNSPFAPSMYVQEARYVEPVLNNVVFEPLMNSTHDLKMCAGGVTLTLKCLDATEYTSLLPGYCIFDVSTTDEPTTRMQFRYACLPIHCALQHGESLDIQISDCDTTSVSPSVRLKGWRSSPFVESLPSRQRLTAIFQVTTGPQFQETQLQSKKHVPRKCAHVLLSPSRHFFYDSPVGDDCTVYGPFDEGVWYLKFGSGPEPMWFTHVRETSFELYPHDITWGFDKGLPHLAPVGKTKISSHHLSQGGSPVDAWISKGNVKFKEESHISELTVRHGTRWREIYPYKMTNVWVPTSEPVVENGQIETEIANVIQKHASERVSSTGDYANRRTYTVDIDLFHKSIRPTTLSRVKLPCNDMPCMYKIKTKPLESRSNPLLANVLENYVGANHLGLGRTWNVQKMSPELNTTAANATTPLQKAVLAAIKSEIRTSNNFIVILPNDRNTMVPQDTTLTIHDRQDDGSPCVYVCSVVVPEIVLSAVSYENIKNKFNLNEVVRVRDAFFVPVLMNGRTLLPNRGCPPVQRGMLFPSKDRYLYDSSSVPRAMTAMVPGLIPGAIFLCTLETNTTSFLRVDEYPYFPEQGMAVAKCSLVHMTVNLLQQDTYFDLCLVLHDDGAKGINITYKYTENGIRVTKMQLVIQGASRLYNYRHVRSNKRGLPVSVCKVKSIDVSLRSAPDLQVALIYSGVEDVPGVDLHVGE